MADPRPDPRKVIQWNRIQGVRARIALAVATALGAGLVPKAPGTAGTLVAIPLAYFTAAWSWPPRVALWFFITLIGTWSAKELDERMGTGDHQSICIDEVLGYGIAAWTAGTEPVALGVAFVLFRFFDIVKPWPVRQIDRWSKKNASPWRGGFGVMADDIVAGIQALLVLLLLQRLGVFPTGTPG